MDNVFVMAVIFAYFRVPLEYQHRVLFWGILGALIMRGAMIGLGAALIDRFDWVLYFLGGILLFTGVKMIFVGDKPPDPGKDIVLCFIGSKMLLGAWDIDLPTTVSLAVVISIILTSIVFSLMVARRESPGGQAGRK